MSKITSPEIVALGTEGETAWEGPGENTVIFQRECPDCDRGLLLAPARFHGPCSGSGFLTRTVQLARA